MTKWLVGELNKVVFTHVLLVGLPTIFYYCLRLGGFSLISLHMAIATFYLLTGIMVILESTNAFFRRYATSEYKPLPGSLENFGQKLKSIFNVAGARYPRLPAVPRCTFLIAAYLPNEQDIILDTLHHILMTTARPEGGLEVILTYNTPVDLPVEADLRLLAENYPELKLLRVEGSRSKAENLNAALEIVTGEVTCILDADHHPIADCFARAWQWINHGYDVVQGRNVIRNHSQNLLTQLVAIEFEATYGVSHAAKSFLTDSSIFGGSNGYWRTSVLQQIRFNPSMLTEDIDASMRTLLNGYRILHDRSIVTTELAPVDLRSFWFQRKRWAQGWLEVSLKYQRRVWKSDKFSSWQKFYWTYLLYYCECYSLIALQIIPIPISLWLFQGFVPQSNNHYLWLSTVIAFVSGIYHILITARIASVRYPISYYLLHCVLLIPYITLKNTIAIVGLYDHVHGYNNWLVTPRGKTQKTRTVARETTLTA